MIDREFTPQDFLFLSERDALPLSLLRSRTVGFGTVLLGLFVLPVGEIAVALALAFLLQGLLGFLLFAC